MKCPNCEYNFLTGNICPECEIDVVIFEKTQKISNVLYNKGLNLARIRDLSGAIDSLTKSIQFNKNNYFARNLLGLVYFEAGKIGDALKQWVISASLMKTGNPAVRYIEEVQRTPSLLDDYNDAVGIYNRAFLYIQQKSDDLAIIQLKKAIDLSPGLIDAINLLTFCYLIQGDTFNASEQVERALELDANNPIAINYYNELHPGRKRSGKKDVKELQKAAQAPLAPVKISMDGKSGKNSGVNNFFLTEIISFIVGGLCVLALLYYTYIPGALASKDKEILTLQDKINTSETTAATQLENSQEKIMRLQKDKEDLLAEITYLNSLVSSEDKSERIALAMSQYNNGNPIEAAKTLYALDPSGLDDSSLSQYNELRTNVYDSAARALYNEGLVHFGVDNNEDASRAFENCLIYAPDDAEYVDDAIYYLGQLAERAGDIEAAIAHYSAVADNYSQSNKLSSINARLQELLD